MRFIKKIIRTLRNDTRCVDCDSEFIAWRGGEWVCPYHDLTPPARPESHFGSKLSDKALLKYYGVVRIPE